jgi:putative transposase
MIVAESLGSEVNTRQACNALSIPRSGFYRWKHRDDKPDKVKIRPAPPLALSGEEDKKVMEILHSDRFVDMAPAEIHATLLDEGEYLCSPRTMYRKLEKHNEVRERRNQLRHPAYSKPELIAKAPNEVWSWDITKLKGPVKWTYFHLYVIMDIFSRYVVGWMIASQELSYLAKELIKQTCEKQGVQRDQLIIHSDRGTSMTSKTVALLMTDLGITKSLSRPHVSNDNPFSEAQFKTLKYRPEFPKRFGCIDDARIFSQGLFSWYNNVHYHSGIGYLSPVDVHYGRSEQIIKERQAVLATAYEKHPERFKGILPHPAAMPEAVWINKPLPERSESEGVVH